jgi:3-deoxy-manno-octulosonate cytidylyltransferase (CMP-KDO synthetase)
LIEGLEKNPSWDIATLSVYVRSQEQLKNSNVVKVVTTPEGRALFFSREPLSVGYGGRFQKHIGVYAYRNDTLKKFCSFQPSPLELSARLEQMRAMENGMTIGVVTIDCDTIAVDTEEDRLLVERHLSNDSLLQKERVV